MLTGPRTVTITEVRKGSVEQPVDIHLAEFPGRPFKPSKTVRRILVSAWGPDATVYTGRRMTLYRDPAVRFGGLDVGGIRVSHLSHIEKPMTLVLAVTKGKRAPYVIKPLADFQDPAKLDKNSAADAITSQQLAELDAGLTSIGITSRDRKLATVENITGRGINSAKDLTPDEAAHVLDWIQAEQANAPAEPDQ
jgi:hypothetical protein